MNELKIYLFNHKEDWGTEGAAAIVSTSMDEAIALYKERHGNLEFEVKELKIKKNLILKAFGYDYVSLDKVTPNSWKKYP